MYRKMLEIVGAGLALSLVGMPIANAQTVEEFYSNNPLTIVASAAGGGGIDTYVRQFAPFLQKHMPGNPDIIITNMPGASGMTAAIHMQAAAPRDGSLITFLQRNNLYLQLVSEVDVEFDPREVNWIGSLNKEAYALLVRSDIEAQVPEDIFSTPIKLGATSYANENRVLPAMMNEFFDTQFDIIPGYDGSPAISLAIERGEVDGRMIAIDYLMGFGIEKPWLEDGQVQVLLQTAMEPDPRFPDAPNILEFTDDPAKRAVAEFFLLPMEAGQPFAAPPGIPEDRLAALRQAFIDAATDPEYLAVANTSGADPKPITGEEVEEVVGRIYEATDETLAVVRTLINPPS